MKPTLLLDVDGVLADFVSAYLSIAVRAATGLEFKPEDVTTWDIHASLGLTEAAAARCKRICGAHPGFARDLRVYPGALDGVARLRDLVEVYIVTSPWNSNPTWTHDREAWLEHHFDIPHSRVIHTSAKHLVRGDVFVDDKTSACREWAQRNPEGIAVRWNTLHNRDENWNGEQTSDWRELEHVVALARGAA